jgi:predicted amidohydrolase
MATLNLKNLITTCLVLILLSTQLLACNSATPLPPTATEMAVIQPSATTAITDTPEPTSTPLPTDTPVPPTATDTAVPPTATITPTSGPQVPFVVAAVSMPVTSEKTANRALFEKYMTEASAQGAQLIVFSETGTFGNPGLGAWNYQPTEEERAAFENGAETIPGETTDWLTEKASQIGIYVIFGMIERAEDGAFYNATVFLGPQGILGTYRKKTLNDNGYGGNEHLFYTRGKQSGTVVDSPLGKIGLIISIEMYVEYGYDLRKSGAELAVAVSAWFDTVSDLYDESTQKTATLCKCWSIVSGVTGPFGHFDGIGRSQILNPAGEILADTGESEGMIVLETGLTIDEAAVPVAAQP